MSANDPLRKRRKDLNGTETSVFPVSWDKHGRDLRKGRCGVRRTGGMTLIWAFVRENENRVGAVKGKGTSGGPTEAESTDALTRGALLRSSDEAG